MKKGGGSKWEEKVCVRGRPLQNPEANGAIKMEIISPNLGKQQI